MEDSPLLHIVLIRPEIPHNTGAIGRLALSVGARIHLIEPLGFSLDEKALRRSGLDYWPQVDLRRWKSWEDFLAQVSPEAHLWYFTTKTTKAHWEATYKKGDFLVFGPESRGIPESLLTHHEESCVTLPMPGKGARSLNLATAVSAALYEGLRQVGLP